ncbi:MAG: tRNA pseudouridine(38-40) synthase TruA [Deltaproteobacteria bacterium]|nr:tRNA pseudouridine(38-40) synthase TruA [Deltaproteobacteria bacterium]MBW2120704.1 tRNA pseudouridine(38-40) synthase TruA [Deltaproteobacteria bacterium]
MRNIKLTIEYDGTAYHGWQVQPNLNTIQGTLQEKIGVIAGESVLLIGAGRTDAGVHALGQVANFRTESRRPLEAFRKGVNSLLPPDIAVRGVEEVSLDFHSRLDAKGKVYEYRILNSPVCSPIRRRFSWHVPQRLDLSRMEEAGRVLLGTHDFTSFRSAGSDNLNPLRTLTGLEILKDADGVISIRIRADGFLKQMARNIVGTLVEVGRGARDPEDLEEILRMRDRRRAGIAAPPRGLFLVEVEY